MAVTEDEIATAYRAALAYAAGRPPGARIAGRRDAIHDAATDAVLWARDHYQSARAGQGGFASFCAAVVRRFVRRAMAADASRDRPDSLSIDAAEWEPAGNAEAAPLTIADLPEELAFTVRLFVVDGYTLRDAGMLLGVSRDTVARRLREAARLLAPGRIAPPRRSGQRRLDGARGSRRSPDTSHGSPK